MRRRRTLIIGTIGPASRNSTVLKGMIRAGLDVARLNFSHGTPADHRAMIHEVRKAFQKAGKPVRLFADLPGPKIRVGVLKNDSVMLSAGRRLLLTVREVLGTERILPVQYAQLTESISKGSLIFLADGFIQLRVLDIPQKGEALCEVLVGGELHSKKGLNIPGARIWADALSRRDLELARMGIGWGLDTFGISFVERAEDIIKLRDFSKALGKRICIIAKIERQEALDNFESILAAADGVMVARGDLGVQMPLEEVPFIQKDLIRRCNQARKTVIIATQMMESMVHSCRPARSDVADVANAVLDGADAVMLSEETAIGDYPVETVEWTAKVCAAAESRATREPAKRIAWLRSSSSVSGLLDRTPIMRQKK